MFALLDRNDEHHAVARETLNELRRRRIEPVLTNFIVAESHALLIARLGPEIARRWLFGNSWTVERVSDADEARARVILGKYDDKAFSYTDASSFAVMERHGLKTAFAFDPHFRQFGFRVLGLDAASEPR